MRKIINKIGDSLAEPLSQGVIILTSLYTVVWGVFVGNPWWDVFDTSPVYSALGGLAPEWFWGLFAVTCGGLSLLSSVFGWPRLAFVSSALAGWHWLIVGLLYLQGEWSNTAGITAIFLSFLCAYIYGNIRANRRQ